MDQIIIRTATLADLDILFSFEQGIISTERPFDPTLREGKIHYYDLAQMIKAPSVEVMVAESDGKIIGSGYARIEESKNYLKHSKHAYLGFMYVHHAYRGKGVNQLIINGLKQWGIAQNVTEMRLEVYHDNLLLLRLMKRLDLVNYSSPCGWELMNNFL